MNADPTDTGYPHLDVGDLIAGASGERVGDRAREHLAGCEYCQLEAKRWGLVSEAVRGLASAAPEIAQPAPSSRKLPRTPAVWRRAVLVVASAAAALVLFIGIGAAAGVVHVHVGGHGSQPVLASVSGCSRLEQADGTLEQVNGTSLVIRTASGRPATVTTSESTLVSMSGPLLSYVTDGASVMVRGHGSGGSIRAAIITVGQPFGAVNPPGFVPLQGTVSDAGTTGFTLITPAGTRIPVTTSTGTLVVIPHASPGQLQPGTHIFAVGSAGPDATLSATAVAAVSQLRSGAHIRVSVRDCSSDSIIEALGAISQASSNQASPNQSSRNQSSPNQSSPSS